MRRRRSYGFNSEKTEVTGTVEGFSYADPSWISKGTRVAVINLTEAFDNAIKKVIIPVDKLEGQPGILSGVFWWTRRAVREEGMKGMIATGKIGKAVSEEGLEPNTDGIAYHTDLKEGKTRIYAAQDDQGDEDNEGSGWKLSPAPAPVAA